MLRGVFGNGNKTSKNSDANTKDKSTTSKIDDTKCIESLRNTKNRLHKFNKTLLSIHSAVNTLLEGRQRSVDQIHKEYEYLFSQITDLYDEMQLEEGVIAALLEENYTAGGRRKSNRRRTKHNRRY